MNKKEIIIELKQKTKNNSINLPERIGFSIVNNVLTITLTDVAENMQENNSSFEGWIICLKSWFPEIDKVELNWIDIEKKDKHYNRFLYRVLQFSRMYSWFSYSKEIETTLKDFESKLTENLKINYPNSKKLESKSGSKKEDKIECLFIKEHEELLKKRLGLKVLDQQLPVGIFKNKVSEGNALFTGAKSAIDLWGINGDDLYIFELKYQNKKVGIISELLFYVSIMQDVFVARKIKYPSEANESYFRNFDKLYDKKFLIIRGYFLVDELHPLINEDVINLINKGVERIGNITVEKLEYSYDNNKIKLK